MTTHLKLQQSVLVGHRIVLICSLLIAVALRAQTAPQASTAALAKYDKNKNGILDPDEMAQQAADEVKAGDAVVLNPFQVSTNKDVGYAAGNTLSGGRIDTPLAITPGSISVMTREFLEDFNISNINDAAMWTIGMELATATPNSTTTTDSTYQATFRGAPADGNFPTRDGNLNFGIADSYNSESFEFSRGPDSTMFGDGGPGGRQGSNSKRGRFNNASTTLAGQVDSFGGYRATVDYNKGWNRVALRLNMLREDDRPYQSDMHRYKTGVTVTGSVRVSKNTLLTAQFENIMEKRNIFGFTIQDSSQYWDNVTVNSNNTAIANPNNFGLEQVSATNDYFTWNFALNEMINYKGQQYRTRGTNLRIPYTGNPNVPDSPARSFPKAMDRKFTLPGGDQYVDRGGQTLQLTAEHQISDLSLRLVYVQNTYDLATRHLSGTPNELRIDVNKLLPDGRPNPKFLHPYADLTSQARNYSEDGVKEVRGVASYRFTVPKFFDYRQRLTMNLSQRWTRNETLGSAWRRVDNPLNPDPMNAVNVFNFRRYWDDPRQNYGWLLTDPNKVPGIVGRWQDVQTAGNKTFRELKSGSLFSQSTFFNEKVAISASYQANKSEVDNLPRFGHSGAPLFQNVLGDGAPGRHRYNNADTRSAALGTVFYPFPTRTDGLMRWISPIGFVLNFSENNQSPGAGNSAPLITGEAAPASSAKTHDFGLRYSIPGGRAYLTVTHYNTEQENIVSGFGSQTQIRNIWLNLGYTDSARTTNEFNFSDVSARKLEGWEVELTANPTRNITLTANYSHPLSYIQSESVYRKEYIATNIAEWKAGAALGNGVTIPSSTRNTIDTQIVRDSLQQIEDSLNGLTTGTLANDTTNHRINFSGRYRFSEGALRGLGFVAGVNYRGYTKSNSRDPRIKFGLRDSQTPTVLQTAQAAYDYLWVPPWYILSAGANYTRRFGKYQTRFQVNVANLLDKHNPIWGRNTTTANGNTAYATFAENAFLTGNPRTQILSGFFYPEPTARKITFSTSVGF